MALDLWTRLDPLRRIRCPFCFERFAAFETHLRCDDHYCKNDYTKQIDDPILSRALNGRGGNDQAGTILRGPWWTDPLRDRRRGIRRFFDWMLLPKSLDCPHCLKPTDCRLCPYCHQELPDSVLTLEAGHLAVFGPQSVGKTTYITVLLHELDHRVGPREGFILGPLTDAIRERYEREYHEPTYGGLDQFGVGEAADSSQRRGHSATPSLETNRGVLRPLVYRLTKKKGASLKSSLISFFDTAGEDWEMNIELLRNEAGYFREARGLLFLIDPLRIRQVANDPRIRLTEKERRVPAADYLDDARKLAAFWPKNPVKTPLAICLNKLDRWGPLMEQGTTLREIVDGLIDSPDAHIDSLIHDEVQSALDRWGATGFLQHIAVNFPNHRFFACSALGDAASEIEDEPGPRPSPLLVERPVLWLLRKQGIL